MKLITAPTDVGTRTGTIGLWAHGTDIYENDQSHIKEIIAAPEVFGLKDSWIRSVFEQHGEKLGIEGDARPEVIQEAAQNGWIRIRHYVTPNDYWSIQGDQSTKERLDQMRGLAVRLIECGLVHRGDQLKIHTYNDNNLSQYLFAQGGDGRFVDEGK